MKNTYGAKTRPVRRLLGQLLSMSDHSLRILNICLPILCFALIIFVVLLQKEAAINPAAALKKYPPMLEYILRSILLALAGALFLDIADKRSK